MLFKKLIKSITPNLLLQIYYDYKNKNKTFFGHHNLDQKLCEFLNYKNGFFVELGANDGIRQSNTFYFEKNLNWNGILIEPIKIKFIKCKKNRSQKNFFFNNACVGFDFKEDKIKMIYSDLMTTIDDDRVINKVDSMKHAQEGKQYLQENEIVDEFYIKTITLHKIFDDVKAPRLMDFLSLDVEGTEFEVLNGINFSIYNFKYIMVESRNDEQLIDYLKNKDYFFLKKISKRDLIFKYKKF
tara:strand:+ start:5723 stop:6445 length:723 start_codon:yes stop_codon:yes gene_type:complete